MKQKYREDPFAFIVLWALFFSAVFLIFAFRGLIAVQFMRKISIDENAHLRTEDLSISNTTTEQSYTQPSNETQNPTSATTITGNGETYTVEGGDTLYAVGQKLGKDWKEIAELNGLEPPYSLDIGQELKLP